MSTLKENIQYQIDNDDWPFIDFMFGINVDVDPNDTVHHDIVVDALTVTLPYKDLIPNRKAWLEYVRPNVPAERLVGLD